MYLLITISTFLFSASCNKIETRACSENDQYLFKVTGKFYPQKRVYSLFDTLFFETIIPNKLIDLNSQRLIDYSNSTDIFGLIGIGLLDSISRNVLPARDSFELSTKVGNLFEGPIKINENIIVGISFKKIDTGYHFICSFVCKKKGVYGISVESPRSKGIINKNCTNAKFDLFLSNSDRNLIYHKEILRVDTFDAELQKSTFDLKVQ